MTTIALLGSGEFLPWARDVDERCAQRATASSDRVLVVPTASAQEGEATFQRWGAMGIDHYGAIGLAPEFIPLRTREDASTPAIVDRIADARLIFFSGGNPGYLAETLSGTPFWDAALDAMHHGTALGGCSAGAVFLGTLAPFVENDMASRWVPGVGLLSRAYIAPHFDALDSYMPGLRKLFISMCPEGSDVVGIDEDTAILGDGTSWDVFGAGAAWVSADGDHETLTPFRRGTAFQAALGLTLP